MAIFYRADGWVKNTLGQAIAGAKIYICLQPADTSFLPPIPLASVFSDPSGMFPITQPIVSDGFGHFDYYAATGVAYTEVVVFGGQVQQVYADQVPMGATLGTTTGVSSVFGRTGTIVAASGDYSFSQISGLLSLGQIPAGGSSSTFLRGDGSWATPAGSGTVTHTGSLTLNSVILGNSSADIKAGSSLPGDATKFLDGTGNFSTPTALTLKHNGTLNGSQSTLNLAQGSNVTITDNGTGTITIASSGGGVTSVFGRTGAVTAHAGDYASVNGLTLGDGASGDSISFSPGSIVISDAANDALIMGFSQVSLNVAGQNFFVGTSTSFELNDGVNEILSNKNTSSTLFSTKILTLASGLVLAGINIPAGVAPSSPVDGDVWTTTSGMFVRINGVTKSLGAGSGNSTTLGTNASFKSSPPASPIAGDAFVCTDSPYEYIYNGSVWDAFVFGYLVVEPILTNFTQVNLGGSTVSTTHGGILMNQVANTGNNNGLIQTSSPLIGAGAYYVDMAFIGMMPAVDGGFGPCVIDNSGGSVGSTSNKMVNGKWGWEGVSTGTPALNSSFEAQHQNNYNSFNSNHGLNTLSQTGPLTWMRMFDDGTTNMTWFVSSDGYNWIQVYQEGRTAFLTPAHAGVTASSFDSRSQGSWHLVHFSIHT